jgi:hypothetical protein
VVADTYVTGRERKEVAMKLRLRMNLPGKIPMAGIISASRSPW